MNPAQAEIINDDCVTAMNAMEPGSMDLIVTSPPYNVGVDYGEDINDSMDYDDYLDWMESVLGACYRVLCDGGRICLNVNDMGRNPLYSIHADLMARMRKTWYLMGCIIWDKQTPLGNTAWGSWESPSAPSLRGRHEYIIVAGKGGKHKAPRVPGAMSGPFFNQPNKKEFLALTTEIWTFTPETNSPHPVAFPYELPSRCIRLFSFVGDRVLDPFCGSGTTLRAARDFGRPSIGIEKNAKFAAYARERVAQETMFGEFDAALLAEKELA